MTAQEFLEHLERMDPGFEVDVTFQNERRLVATLMDEDSSRWHVDLKKISP